MKIITVTLNAAVDVVVSENEYKKTGIKKAVRIPAGKGINVSRALECAGISSTAIAIVGEKELPLFKTLNSEYVDTRFVTFMGETRNNITLTECEDGKEHHYRTQGFPVTSDEYKKVYDILMDLVCETDWVIFSGSTPPGFQVNCYEALIRLCKSKGAYTGLDTSGQALLTGIQAAPYFIKPNKSELEGIYGKKIHTTADKRDILSSISSMYDIPIVLATFGDEGAAMYSYSDELYIEKEALPEKETKVTSVGCGDATVAGFLSGLIKHFTYEESLNEAMSFANANLYSVVPGNLKWENPYS